MKKISILLAAMASLVLPIISCTTQKEASETSSTGFEVIDFLPGEIIPEDVIYPSIQIQFSEPVVPLSRLGKPSDKCEFASIEPAMEGVWRWYGTSLLSFECSQRIIPQKIYTLKVNKNLTSASGNSISGKLSYTFSSPEVRLVNMIPGFAEMAKNNYVNKDSVPTDLAKDIAVFLNCSADIKELQKHLKVTGISGGKNIEYKYSAKAEDIGDYFGKSEVYDLYDRNKTANTQFIRITVQDKIEENIDVKVVLPAGTRTCSDGIAKSEENSISFHTLRPFEFKDFDSDPYVYGYENPVEFEFTSDIQPETEYEVASRINSSIGPVKQENVKIIGNRVIVHGLPVEYGSSYSLTLEGGFRDIYGRTLELKSPVTKEISISNPDGMISFTSYGNATLESQFTPKIMFTYRNLKANSYYKVTQLAKADGTKADGSETITNLPSVTDNKTKYEIVDLSKNLQKTAGGKYRGTVKFEAEGIYDYYYRNWRTNEITQEETRRSNSQIIQVTDLGVTVRYGYNAGLCMVSSLSTGKPIADAKVNILNVPANVREEEIFAGKYSVLASTLTDKSGFAQFRFADGLIRKVENGKLYVEVTTGDDHIIFAPNTHNMWRFRIYDSNSPEYAEKSSRLAFLYSDRQLYKPGETVKFSGIDRDLKLGKFSAHTGEETVVVKRNRWRYYGEDDEEKPVADLKIKLSPQGTFSGSFKIPEDAEPGNLYIMYGGDEKTISYCPINIQFFERLKFEISSSIPDVTYYAGDTINASVKSNYLGGGNLGNAAYDSYWTSETSYFSLDEKPYRNFVFGPRQGYDGRSSLGTEEGVTGADGSVNLSCKTGAEKLNGWPYVYTMNTTIRDASNQSISTTSSVKVHPASFYIGLSKAKNIKGFAKKGSTLKFDTLCVTPEGTEPSENFLPKNKKSLKVELLREEWKQVQQLSWNGRIVSNYERSLETESESTVEIRSRGTQELSVTPKKGGAYMLRLSTTDSAGREVITERSFYVIGSDWNWYSGGIDSEIKLETDKDIYSVGDKAQILMQSPLPAGKYLVTIEREGISSYNIIDSSSPVSVIDVDIKEEYVPVMYVAVTSFSKRTQEPPTNHEDKDMGMPKSYFGVVPLKVDTASRSFDISIEPTKKCYKPGEKVEISLTAKDKKGIAVPDARITLLAVDRGVIDLVNYHVPNPVNYFYEPGNFPECVKGGDSRSILMEPVAFEKANLMGGDAAESKSKMTERKNFEPTAAFLPDLTTDANGKVKVSFTLPDSLTAYRITAVGCSTESFALSENEISVSNPISARSFQPVIMRRNDKAQFGVTLTNLQNVDSSVSVSVKITEGSYTQKEDEDLNRTAGSAMLIGESSKTVTAKRESTTSADFLIEAKKPGWITVEYTIEGDSIRERLYSEVQIQKPYISETVSTSGILKDGMNTLEEKVIVPDAEGNLRVQLDSTRLGSLEKAVEYLVEYPFDCIEQKSSRLIALICFGDHLKQFGLDGAYKNYKKFIEKELKYIAQNQNSDGGFPYWSKNSYCKHSNQDTSSQVALMLYAAKDKGYKIPDELSEKNLADYLNTEANKCKEKWTYAKDGYYYAAKYYYAASRLMGKDNKSIEKKLDSICSSKENCTTPVYMYSALAYEYIGAHDKATQLENKIKGLTKLSTQGIEISNISGDIYSLYDDNEIYALALSLYSTVNVNTDLQQRCLFELGSLQKKFKGYWRSTRSTAHTVLSFYEYSKANKVDGLKYTAEILLDGLTLAQGKFEDDKNDPVAKEFTFDSKELADVKREEEIPLTIKKNGKGNLFYNASMKYYLNDDKIDARDEGICVYTEIIDIKTGKAVEDGKLKTGNIYKQVVHVSSTQNRSFVALRASVPAGCEILNFAFSTTGTQPPEVSTETSWWQISKSGIYEGEVRYFWDNFYRGNQKAEFLFRANRPGTYCTPPTTAECMYEAEIFGRTSGQVWTIEQR